MIPNGFDTENGVRVSRINLSYIQDADTNSDGVQTLEIETQDSGTGHYFVMKTERWAFDDIDELVKLLEDFKKKTSMNPLKYNYEKSVEAYINAFCVKQEMDFESWVANDVGTIACFGDVMYFGFDDIRYDIDTNQPAGQIITWLYDAIDHEGININYRSYSKGLRYEKPLD